MPLIIKRAIVVCIYKNSSCSWKAYLNFVCTYLKVLLLIFKSCVHLEQAAQSGCGCLIPWRCSRQVGWGPGQSGLVPDLEVGGSACGRGLELNDPWDLFQPKPFYDSLIMKRILEKLSFREEQQKCSKVYTVMKELWS